MKKWIALLLVLCLFLPGAAICEAATETTETAEEAAQPTAHEIRYYFEHRLLPQFLYEDPATILNYLDAKGVFALWSSFTQNNGLDLIYSQEDFAQALIQKDDGTSMMLVFLPRPEDTPLCSRVYLCWNPETDKKGYYTVEYDNFFGESWFLCGWSEEGTHLNFGGADALPDPDDPGYQAALDAETDTILNLMNSDAQPEASYDPATNEISN